MMINFTVLLWVLIDDVIRVILLFIIAVQFCLKREIGLLAPQKFRFQMGTDGKTQTFDPVGT